MAQEEGGDEIGVVVGAKGCGGEVVSAEPVVWSTLSPPSDGGFVAGGCSCVDSIILCRGTVV